MLDCVIIFETSLENAGIQLIHKRFLRSDLMIITLILFVGLSFVFLILYDNQPTKTSLNKSEVITIKDELLSVKKSEYKNKGGSVFEGIYIKLKHHPKITFHIKKINIFDDDADKVLNLRYDTASYFISINKADYKLWIAKTTKPNFRQKYFNNGIEINGMRSYQKTYFEVFR